MNSDHTSPDQGLGESNLNWFNYDYPITEINNSARNGQLKSDSTKINDNRKLSRDQNARNLSQDLSDRPSSNDSIASQTQDNANSSTITTTSPNTNSMDMDSINDMDPTNTISDQASSIPDIDDMSEDELALNTIDNSNICDPQTYKQAMNSTNSPNWNKAMLNELASLKAQKNMEPSRT
ncbi:hypothetical protein N7G274_008718 [Stereocaulon virgatum]|uniref:Uncharacterized protein n=1 Tax=Stereocaulon virgatum TaxID=373712 RepID=A0ABR4A0S5_9LECA